MGFFEWLAIGFALLFFYHLVALFYEPNRNKPLEQICSNCGEQTLFIDYSKGGRWDGRLGDGRKIGGSILCAQCRECGARFECYRSGLFPDKWQPREPEIKKRVERVPLASHIIVGTAKKLRVVELVDGQIREVVPEPLELEKQFIEIEIEVEEVMYPPHWQAGTTIRHYYRGGYFGPDGIRRDCIGQRKIYLLKSLSSQMTEAEYQAIKNAGEGEVFVQAYGWDLADDYERKFQFDNLVAARIEREEAEIKRD